MKTNPVKHLKPRRRLSRKGIALITVLSLLAITTLLIAAFFSLAKVELISSDTYAKGIRSRQLAETAVNVAMSQIRKATIPPAGSDSVYYAWASQPGAIRKYDLNGNFYEAYKLYSDNNMIIDASEGERSLVDDSPPADWEDQPERYVDLNAPVVRRGSSGEFDERFFPILDPRAAQSVDAPSSSDSSSAPSTLAPIKGFSYTDEYLNGTKDDQVVLPKGTGNFDNENDDSHIPMPVEWLYVLQDGTLGFLDENNDDRFVGKGPNGADVSASLDNPIVGRIAFWADDETTKININTASEPTFWNMPWVYSDVDFLNAMRQPGRREFQRYPGHPATTALSPVLFPDMYDNYSSTTPPETTLTGLQPQKEEIFALVPRIGEGGSKSGTLEINEVKDAKRNFTVTPVQIDDDRLFASLDELIFSTEMETVAGGETRKENPLLDARTLQRAQFFLTANSRAPETNLFNMPRIGIWPIHRRAVPPELGGDSDHDERYGSGFDNMIAFCSTVNGIPYYFKREDADDPFHDLRPNGIKDNFDLFHSLPKGYLWNLADTPIPGYGRSFTDKYGDAEAHQILTEIFDYIRCVNLHDDLVAPDGGYDPNPSNGNRPITENWYTFTDPRSNRIRRPGETTAGDEHVFVYTGHGQVTPIETPSRAPNETSRGMGRFFTLSEVALHFICSADGDQDAEGHPGGRPDGVPLGGANGSAVRSYLKNNFGLDGDDKQTAPWQYFGGAAAPASPGMTPPDQYWFSGFPPLPQDLIPTGKDSPGSPSNYPYMTKDPTYPGYDPRNWNYALGVVPPGTSAETVRNQYLLKPEERLVQMMIHFETFSPSLGWTQINPSIFFVIKGIDSFELDGHPLFANLPMGNVFFASAASGFSDGGFKGGSNGIRGFVRNKRLPARNRIDDDLAGGSGVPAILPDAEWTRNAGPRNWLVNPIVSNVITVKDPSEMEFTGGSITVEIWLGRSPGEAGTQKIQSFEMNVPDGGFVTPQLVMYGTPTSGQNKDGRYTYHATAAPYWWSFHRSGCYGGPTRMNGQPGIANKPTPLAAVRGGRAWDGPASVALFDTEVDHQVSPKDRPRIANFIRREDTVQTLVPWHGDYRHVLAAQKVKESDALFIPHSFWGRKQHAHNLYIAGRTDRIPDFATSNNPMLAGVGRGGEQSYPKGLWPDFPLSKKSINARGFVSTYRDLDNGMAATPDGPYINKPDEGDSRIVTEDSLSNVPYLTNNWRNEATGPSFFSPNRQMPSPVMFGSLPSGIKGTSGIFGGKAFPWRTLLFRPPEIASPHPGERDLPSKGDVPDHILLDFFWMPVIEPYAISEPFSTAGKINLNYQILPFTNITRSTGIYGLLRGEKMLCYPNADTLDAKRRPGTGRAQKAFTSASGERWWDNTKKQWWRDVDIEETLKQFDDTENGKFSRGEIFRSASEICEVSIVPTDNNGRTAEEGGSVKVDYIPAKKAWRMSQGGKEFYGQAHKVTGDNARERPYVNIYPRVTTKSNTFQVHYRVQTVQKSSFTDPEKVDVTRDAATSEFRGSTIIERYIDPNDPEIPDYREFKQKPEKTPPLDKFYRYRIVSTKRFAP